MSKRLQTEETNKIEYFLNDNEDFMSSETQRNTKDQLANEIFDKQQSLVDKANNTFKDLCKILENEQTKLLELEERRKKLQEEMLLLKAEIEQEKQSFNINLVQSVAENLNVLNNNKVSEDIGLKILNEDQQSFLPITARNEETSIQEHAQYIRSDVQNILSECIPENCNNKTE